MSLADLPIPQNAKEKIPEGEFEVKIDLITSRILDSLREEHSEINDKLLFLQSDAEWSVIEGFYNEHLLEKGFEKINSKHFDRQNYYLAIWTNKGFLSNETVAVAFINSGMDKENKPMKFLNIFTAK